MTIAQNYHAVDPHCKQETLFMLLSVWSVPTKIPGTGNMIYLRLNASKSY